MKEYNQLLIAFEQLTGERSYTAVLKQAWKLYIGQDVQKVNLFAGNMMNGIVKDIELHAVVLDIDQFRYSSCTCQQVLFCEHMAAVFFQYSRSLDNGKVLAEQAYFQLLGLMHASQSNKMKQRSASEVSKGTTPAEVLTNMKQLHGEDWKKCKHSLHPLSHSLTELKGMAKQSEYELQRIHWCMSILFVLHLGERALSAVDSFSRYYHEMTFKRIADPWSTQLKELMLELEQQPLQYTERDWVQQMMNFIYEQIMGNDKLMFDWEYTYYSFQSMMASDAVWCEAEQIKLEAAIGSYAESDPVQTFFNAALATLQMVHNEDEQAIAYLNKCQFDRVQRLIYPMIERRMQESDWHKVELWMNQLYKQFEEGRQIRSIGPFLTLCRKANSLQPESRLWTDYMFQLLPNSYVPLSDHLLEQQYYAEWADLQIFMGRKPEDFNAQDLKKIEKQAPSVLLPLYHQAIDIALQSRNRQGYRMAAKHMKILKSIYIELEDEQRWKQFFSIIQQKTARLRAFQEELLKGKLV